MPEFSITAQNPITVNLSDGTSSSSVSTASLTGGATTAGVSAALGRGLDGKGWTGVTYDTNTGRFTFTSDGGLGYVSDDITVGLGDAVVAAEAAQAGAEAAEAATEALFDQFGDQYLGPKASDPTVDNDGDPLTEGDIYFNTTDSVLKFYSGTAWVAPESISTTAAVAAQAAQAAAETAQAAAETAQAAAETAEANAATSETNAATSETNAAASASASADSATDAAASLATLDLSAVDVSGGTINGTVIGGTTPAAITGTAITGTSFATTGNMTFGDNDKAIFGASNDLQIWHDSTAGASKIYDAGAGDLELISNGGGVRFKNPSDEETFSVTNGGATTVYYNRSPKLATSSTGVDITGTLTSAGLTVGDGHTIGDDGFDNLVIASSAAEGIILNSNTFATVVKTDDEFRVEKDLGADRFKVDTSTGDISFYEDTGTTPKFFWDASAESLGIGTSTQAAALEVRGVAARIRITDSDLSGTTGIEFVDSAGTVDAEIEVGNSTQYFAVKTAGSEAMRVTSGGNVGINTTAPTEKLEVAGNISVSGTVDGRDVATDGTKLDGIEAGATSDQTAAQLLTAIKTVDGSGSGLDADLLDGLQLTSGTRNDVANQVMRTQANGYAEFGWINTTSGATTTASSDYYVNTNDGYIRKKTLDNVRTELGILGFGQTWQNDSGRVANTWYQNTTGAAIMVHGRVDCDVRIGVSTGSYQNIICNNGSSYGLADFALIVPPNNFYLFTSVRTGTGERTILR